MEPVGYADQRRLEAQRETGAQRRVRRTAVARFPYALFLSCRPFRCSTAGALAKAWNTRGNGPYTLDPYTPTSSAQRVYGSRRLPWSSRHLAVRPFCRPWQRRTGASSAPFRARCEARADTRTGHRTKRQRRRAQLGHRIIAPCCRRRLSHGAKRSAIPRRRRVRLWKSCGSSAAPAPRCPPRRALVAGPSSDCAVSPSGQHMSHRVGGGRSTAPHRRPFWPGRSALVAPAPTDERVREASTSTAGPFLVDASEEEASNGHDGFATKDLR